MCPCAACSSRLTRGKLVCRARLPLFTITNLFPHLRRLLSKSPWCYPRVVCFLCFTFRRLHLLTSRLVIGAAWRPLEDASAVKALSVSHGYPFSCYLRVVCALTLHRLSAVGLTHKHLLFRIVRWASSLILISLKQSVAVDGGHM